MYASTFGPRFGDRRGRSKRRTARLGPRRYARLQDADEPQTVWEETTQVLSGLRRAVRAAQFSIDGVAPRRRTLSLAVPEGVYAERADGGITGPALMNSEEARAVAMFHERGRCCRLGRSAALHPVAGTAPAGSRLLLGCCLCYRAEPSFPASRDSHIWVNARTGFATSSPRAVVGVPPRLRYRRSPTYCWCRRTPQTCHRVPTRGAAPTCPPWDTPV